MELLGDGAAVEVTAIVGKEVDGPGLIVEDAGGGGGGHEKMEDESGRTKEEVGEDGRTVPPLLLLLLPLGAGLMLEDMEFWTITPVVLVKAVVGV